MGLQSISSPHLRNTLTTPQVMRLVLLATLPGIFALTWHFGIGTLLNLIWACGFAVVLEAAMLWLRKRPIAFYLNDCSALVTAVLLAVALPPAAPWWLIAIGLIAAMVFAKHLYGGIGYNPFNPAMVGYVVLLISFPVQMTAWVPERESGTAMLGMMDALGRSLALASQVQIDAFTSPTPLDLMKQNSALLMDDLWQRHAQFGRWGGAGWEWVNLAFLAGGLFLLYRRLFTWHAPVAMLGALGMMAAMFYDGGSSASGGSPLFHWLTGATMLGAFFIVTDPVTSAVSARGKLIYGAAVGVLVYLIRHWGSYPDAIAFAILLMNFAAPFIDYYTQPRVYGHAPRRTEREKR